jgi:hypothetical protein
MAGWGAAELGQLGGQDDRLKNLTVDDFEGGQARDGRRKAAEQAAANADALDREATAREQEASAPLTRPTTLLQRPRMLTGRERERTPRLKRRVEKPTSSAADLSHCHQTIPQQDRIEAVK